MKKQSYYYFFIILSCLCLLGAIKPGHFKITGIKREVLVNVKERLAELYQKNTILNRPFTEIQAHIENAMQPFGFFQPDITITRSASGKKLLIRIKPGPQMLITSFSAQLAGEGENDIKINEALHRLPLKAGQPLNNKLYDEAKEKLLNTAEQQGYLHATFKKSEILIDKKRYTTHITLLFDTGPRYYFGQVRFDPTYISPKLLARFIPFKFGSPYSTEEILAFNRNLAASGYFKSVVVKPQINSLTHVPIDVHLQRNHRINYTLGLGYGTDTGPRGRAGVSVVPVNRSGHKFNAMVQGSLQENALITQYIIPGRNPVTDNFNINGSVSTLNYNSGYSNAYQLSLAQQHMIENFQRVLSLNALNERFNYSYEPKTTKTVIYPKALLTWRKVSEQLFSPSGYNLTFTGLGSSKVLLSEINMVQATADLKAAITVDPIRTRFFFHAIGGAVQINDINNLPLSLALLLGGSENLKAYSYNAIGPGQLLSFGSIEVQKETFKKWYLIGFVDSGDVYHPADKLFKYDTGIGLMWVSPIGPIKIALAQAMNNSFMRLHGHTPKLVISMGPDL